MFAASLNIISYKLRYKHDSVLILATRNRIYHPHLCWFNRSNIFPEQHMSRNYFRAETIYLFVSMINKINELLSLRLLQARRKKHSFLHFTRINIWRRSRLWHVVDSRSRRHSIDICESIFHIDCQDKRKSTINHRSFLKKKKTAT